MVVDVLRFLKREALLGTLLTYLTLCILLGGASLQAFYAHGVLQSTAAVGIAILIATWPNSISLVSLRVPIALICAMTLVGFAQSVPIPWFAWSILPGRNSVVEGFQSLGIDSVALPISLDAEATVASLGYALIPLFVLLLCARIGLQRLKRRGPIFLCVVGFLSVILGLFQVFGGHGETLYLYENATHGVAAGTFANVNHFGSLMLMVFPFAILLTRKVLDGEFHMDLRVALIIALCTLIFFLTLGVGAAGSLAVYFMFLPSVGLAVLGTRNRRRRPRGGLITGVAACLIVAIGIGVVSTSPILSDLAITGDPEGPTSRQSVWVSTSDAIHEFWPVGSGVGTFKNVIPKFEDADNVHATYVALAHNEYLQITLEFGAIGVAAIGIALVWLIARAKSIWFSLETGETQTFRRMALLGILICVLHSLVDYPARTPAIASLLALYVALIALPKNPYNRGEEQTSNKANRVML